MQYLKYFVFGRSWWYVVHIKDFRWCNNTYKMLRKEVCWTFFLQKITNVKIFSFFFFNFDQRMIFNDIFFFKILVLKNKCATQFHLLTILKSLFRIMALWFNFPLLVVPWNLCKPKFSGTSFCVRNRQVYGLYRLYLQRFPKLELYFKFV